MEIKINKCLLFNEKINGITGEYSCFLDFIFNLDSQNIFTNGKKLTKKEKKKLNQKISIIQPYIEDYYLHLSIYDYMKFQIIESYMHLKDYRKKIYDSLKIVGLKKEMANRRIDTLSFTELKPVNFAKELLFNPDILIFNDFLSGFDLMSKKKIFGLLNKLKEKYKKLIIICSSDVEDVYRYCETVIIYKDSHLLIQGDIREVYENNSLFLKQKGILIPYTVEFTNLVRDKKHIKLGYHKDIRDLIKDIYKKV